MMKNSQIGLVPEKMRKEETAEMMVARMLLVEQVTEEMVICKELGMTIMKGFGRERLLVEGMRKQEALRMKKLLVNLMMKTINQQVAGELELRSSCSCG